MKRPPESEADFQAAVQQLAHVLGWRTYHTFDSRRSTEGFPDLVLARDHRLLFVELKSAKGRVSAAQQDWLDTLAKVATLAANVQVFVWRPDDWPDIERQLRSRWPLA